jgi:hypothetical protein
MSIARATVRFTRHRRSLRAASALVTSLALGAGCAGCADSRAVASHDSGAAEIGTGGEGAVSSDDARSIPEPTEGGANDASVSAGDDVDSSKTETQLFNGRDLSGWNTYLGPPVGATAPVGENTDPQGVFSVVTIDGAPAIRISGETWGALSTVDEFANYHLHAEFRWGTHAVWPPLTVRDGGLLYHSVGPYGAVLGGGGTLADPPLSAYFMTSMELQIAQGDVGSYYALGPITVDGGAFSQAASGQYENAVGEWNDLDVFVVGGDSLQVVNGKAVVLVKNATLTSEDGGRVPLVRGRIQLQSESMEIYFRAITMAPIDRLPADSL